MADGKRTKMGTGQISPVGNQITSPPAAPSQPATTPAPGASLIGAALQPQGDPLIGQTLADRYTISKKLGEGGMGAVYLATHTLLDKQVALKVLHGEFVRKPDLVERFMQEAKAASRIRHENVIDISDFGATPDGLVFFAMELLKGRDLHEDVSRARLANELLPWVRTKRIFLQICAALHAAHKQGIIHRDLKPENVYLVEFLGEADFVKLLDFGIAKMTEVDEGGRKLTKTGMLFGTPEYMSPEQARGDKVDHRVDIYAMGCILFQLVTGRTPFEAENFMGVLTMHLTAPIPTVPPDTFDRIGAPREISGIIEKALSKEPASRWQSIEELANAIRMVCGDPASGLTGTAIPQQRAPSVPASGPTRKAEWTGNVSVPHEEDAPVAKRASKLPLVLGAVVLLGGAGVGAFVMASGGGKGDGSAAVITPGSGTGSATQPMIAGSGGSAATVTPPDAAVAVVQPALPDRVTITFVTEPKVAAITDVTNNTPYKAVKQISMPGGRGTVQFQVSAKGYRDAIVQVVPDKDQSIPVTLEKGANIPGQVTRPGTGPGSAKPPGPGSAVPPPGPGSAATPTNPTKPTNPPTPPGPGDDPNGPEPLKDPFKNAPAPATP